MKKVLSLVLSIIMCLSVLSVCVFADSSTSNEPIVYSGDALTSAYLKVSGNGDVTAPTYANGYYSLTGGAGASSTQLYFTLASEVDGSVYKYMVIKYRYAENYAKAGISVNRWSFVDSSSGTDVTVGNSRSVDGQIATYADGEWQVAIIDMTSISFEANKENNVYYAQGKTWANYKYNKEISIMPYGWNGVAGSVFDLEYFGFFASEDDANKYVSEASGIVIDSENDMIAASSDTVVTYDEDGGFFRFDYKSGGSSGYIGAKFKAPIDFEGSVGKYMAIKYRYDKDYDKAGISIYRHNISGTDANNNNVEYTISSRSQDGQIATRDDGEWQVAVIDMSAISFEFQKYDKTNYLNAAVAGGKSWGDYTYTELSILPFGWNRPEGAQFDIEYIAFFNTEEKAEAYTSNTQVRGHQKGDDGTSVRFIGGIDTLDCHGVGFEISANGKTWGDEDTDITGTVYTSIVADEKTVTAGSLASKYLFCAEISGIPVDTGEVEFTVKAFKLVNGERVYSSVEIVTVEF